MNFYTPIFFLLSKYNGREDGEEEALKTLDNQVREFLPDLQVSTVNFRLIML